MKRFLVTEDEKKYIRNLYNLIVESPIPGLDLKSGVYWFIVEHVYNEFYRNKFIDGWNQIKNVCDTSKIYNEVIKIKYLSNEYKALLSVDKQEFEKITDVKYPGRWDSLLVIVNDKNEITKLINYTLSEHIKHDSDEIIAAIKTTKFTPTETTVPKVNPTEPNVTKEPEKPKEPEAETQTSEKSPEAQGLIGKNITLYRNRNNLKDKGEVIVKDIQENPQNGHVTITVVPTNTFQGKGKEFTLNYKCENVSELKTPSGKTYYSDQIAPIFFKKYCELVANKGIFNKPKN